MKDFLEKQVVLVLAVFCFRTLVLLELYFVRVTPAGANVGLTDLFGYMIAVPLTIFAICYRNKKVLQMIGSALLLLIWWIILFVAGAYLGFIPWIEDVIGMELISDTDEVGGIIEVFYLLWVSGVNIITIVLKAINILLMKIRQNREEIIKHTE